MRIGMITSEVASLILAGVAQNAGAATLAYEGFDYSPPRRSPDLGRQPLYRRQRWHRV